MKVGSLYNFKDLKQLDLDMKEIDESLEGFCKELKISMP
jgi:hypothetical protein